MPVSVSHPGVYVDEVPGGGRTIAGVSTSIALFVGGSAKGAIDKPVRVKSFAEFEREFGGLDARSLLAYAISQFFGNGGGDAYVLRIAAGAVAGVDGEVLSPADSAFHAALLARFGVGSMTDGIDLFNLVCVPGLIDAATLAALQTECHRRRAFLIVDGNPDLSIAAAATAGTIGLTGHHASCAAIYFPWVRAADPLRKGAMRAFPPCGFVAGILARTDARRGVWTAPAGLDASLAGATSLTLTPSDAQCGRLNALGINCLRTFSGHHIVWGARTLHGQDERGSEWKYVPVRRTALFIEESLFRGTRWVAFEQNDEPLWSQIRLSVGAFMNTLFRQGAFQARSQKDAYFVKCDRETTTQDDIDHGIVNIHVGFAPLKPAEFVVIRIRQVAGKTTH